MRPGNPNTKTSTVKTTQLGLKSSIQNTSKEPEIKSNMVSSRGEKLASSQFMDAKGTLLPSNYQNQISETAGKPIVRTAPIQASETESKFLLNSMAKQISSKGTTEGRLAPKVSIGVKKSNGSEIDRLLSAMGNQIESKGEATLQPTPAVKPVQGIS